MANSDDDSWCKQTGETPRHAGDAVDDGSGAVLDGLHRGRHVRQKYRAVYKPWLLCAGVAACALSTVIGIGTHHGSDAGMNVDHRTVDTSFIAASRSFDREPLSDTESTTVDGDWGGIEKIDVEYSRSAEERRTLDRLRKKHGEAVDKLEQSSGKVQDNDTRDSLEKHITEAASFIRTTGDTGAVDTDKANKHITALTNAIKTVDQSISERDERVKEEAERNTQSNQSGTDGNAGTNGDNGAPVSVPTGEMQQWAHDYMLGNGYTEADWNAANFIINHESGWNPSATNPSSGAYGLPQALPGSKMASHGADWATNYQTQFKWFLNYCNRYGGVSGAYAFWQANHWY